MREMGGDAKALQAGGRESSGRADDKVPVLLASHLLGATGIVHIEHAGQIYTLRRTRNGRLLLTK